MSLPYESCTTGDRALLEIQKMLKKFGCTQFGHMVDEEMQEVRIMFTWRNRNIILPGSIRGYAAAWLKEHPYSHRMRRSKIEHERDALKVGSIAVYSILRDWVKGNVTAVETGMLTFEGAFLGQIMLPSGQSVLEAVRTTNMLPQLEYKP